MSSGVTITRDVLYHRVWATPMRTLANEFGISDVALAKWCRKLAIPVPGRGYWAKVRAGAAPRMRPLPPARGRPESIELRPHARREPVPTLAKDLPRDPRLPAVITVPERLSHPHPLVRETASLLREARADPHGLLRAAPYARDCLPVKVSPAALPRALRLLDALLKALVRLGASFRVDRSKRTCAAVLEEVEICLSLRESYTQRRLTEREIAQAKKTNRYFYERFAYQVTGKLELKLECWAAGVHSAFRDGCERLEEQLAEVLSIALATPAQARERETARRAEEARWRAAEARAQALEEAREAERTARRALLAEAQSWRDWETVNAYLDALEAALGAAPAGTGEARDWLKGARRRAEALNPLSARLAMPTEPQAT